MKLSIIIPVFNEEKTIGKVIQKVLSLKIPNITKEIIVVDDGSTDSTAKNVKEAQSKNKNLVFLQHEKNLGKGAAINTGIQKATGDYVIIQDADLEYNPDEIIKLIAPILQNRAKVVYGTRLRRFPNFARDERTIRFLIHYVGNKFLSLLTSILYGHWITDMETCYKIFPKRALNNVRLKARRFDFEPEITAKLLKQNYKILEVPISTNPRGYNEGKKLNTFKDGIIALLTLLKFRFID